MTERIEKLIERLDAASEDQNICGVDAGRTGSCHAAWTMEEAATTMRDMLAVVKAAKDCNISFDVGCDCETCEPASRLYKSLAKLEQDDG